MLPDKNTPVKLPIGELAVLITNFLSAVKNKEIGFEDAERELNDFFSEELKRTAWVTISLKTLEGLLWGANSASEAGEFWEPRGKSFDKYTGGLLRYVKPDGESVKFDKDYNVIAFRGDEGENDG